MTREEAERQAEERNRGGEDRFFARERGGEWEVVRVELPPGMRIDPVKASVESRPKPRDAPDPRPGGNRHIVGY